MLRRQIRPDGLRIAPAPEGMHHRLAVRRPAIRPGFTGELLSRMICSWAYSAPINTNASAPDFESAFSAF